MKKTALAQAFLSALLFLAISGTLLIREAKTNPYIPSYFPLEPVTTPPAISVNQPLKDQIYGASEVWLNFSIIKPEAWFVHDVAWTENGSSKTLTIGQITSSYYVLDNRESKNITLNDGGLPSEYSIEVVPNRILNFSIHLTLPEGMHTVKIFFEANSYHYTGWDDPDPGLRSTAVNGSSEAIRFNVGSPFSTTLLIGSVIAVAVVCFGLLVYFKKRNPRRGGKA
jgi:hypothetical protein